MRVAEGSKETRATWETMRAAARAYARDPSEANARRLSEAVLTLRRLQQRRQALRQWRGSGRAGSA